MATNSYQFCLPVPLLSSVSAAQAPQFWAYIHTLPFTMARMALLIWKAHFVSFCL